MSKTMFLTQSNLPNLKEIEERIKKSTGKDINSIKKTKQNEDDLMHEFKRRRRSLAQIQSKSKAMAIPNPSR